MKRVLMLTLFCLAALLFAISSVIFIERGQAPIGNLSELHVCDKTMCLFDIAPSKTTIRDAQATLKTTRSFTFSNFSDSTAFKQSKPFYRVDVEPSSGCNRFGLDCTGVMRMVFPLNQNELTAGQIITELGSPCGIVPNFIRGRTVLIYRGMVLYFISNPSSDAERFQPTLPLGQINIFKNADSCHEVASKTEDYYRWRGFTIYPTEP
jgi:hypothetical protein